jgi:cytochrome c oxidase cbb3-type subunit 3
MESTVMRKNRILRREPRAERSAALGAPFLLRRALSARFKSWNNSQTFLLLHGARSVAACLFSFFAILMLSGCDQFPGKPNEKDRWKPPEANKDFADLYATNCLGCHSNGETISAAISMHDPVFLQIIPKETMRKIISDGIPGTPMPSFAQAHGGELTEEQIDLLAQGIYQWSKGNDQTGLPPYSAPPGDAHKGATVYAESCANCHGKEGTGGKAGSVVDPAYLSLVSDQYLRSVVVAGRPELGMPNFRDLVPGKPLSAEQIADVVAWLASHRAPSSEEAKPATAKSN